MAIWAKTAAGRIEMQARALVKERAQRNLLLLIDGNKSDEMLLGSLVGIGHDDFLALESLGLIEPAGAAVRAPEAPAAAAGGVAPQASVAGPLDYAQFTTALTQMISKELGLRGFMLTLAVDKASTVEELQDVARRTLEQIRERKGEAVAAAARHTLYGS